MPKRSLMLAGGGLKIAFQAGVLQVWLDEAGIEFDHGDGVSAASFNLVMWVQGFSGTQIADNWRHFKPFAAVDVNWLQLLKLFYAGSGRLYLEHLVVALYSHAFLCLALLGQFALLALDHLATPHFRPAGIVVGLMAAALWLWMPAYLLLMQKRVYRQGWLLTAIKFVALGGVYSFVLGNVALALTLVSLARA